MDDLDLSGYESSDKGGCYDLWVRVFLDSVLALQSGKNSPSAYSFVFDSGNPFLEMVADGLNISSDVLRKRIRLTIEQSRPAPKVSLRGKIRRKAGV